MEDDDGKWVQVTLQLTCPHCGDYVAHQVRTHVVDVGQVDALFLQKILQSSTEKLTRALGLQIDKHICVETPEHAQVP